MHPTIRASMISCFCCVGTFLQSRVKITKFPSSDDQLRTKSTKFQSCGAYRHTKPITPQYHLLTFWDAPTSVGKGTFLEVITFYVGYCFFFFWG
jgi:hypothetical protein